jgi:two-component system OmpR family sensor kinase
VDGVRGQNHEVDVLDAGALAPDRTVRLTGLDGAASPSGARTTGDDARLRQVLSNLVANAVRHTPEGTAVEVGVGTRGDWALWQVRDHGPGISPGDAERVFERFFRADASRHRAAGGGSGLGLAIVAAVTSAHGGAARVVPTEGGGATFEVALPSRGATVGNGPGDRHGPPEQLTGGSQA